VDERTILARQGFGGDAGTRVSSGCRISKANAKTWPIRRNGFMDSPTYEAELLAFSNNPPVTQEPARIYFAYNQLTYTNSRRERSSIHSEVAIAAILRR
jgi:hypothetical protein